jgi:hypothetical protein
MATRVIEVHDPNLSAIGVLTIKTTAISPLIQKKFSEKAIQQIEDAQQGKAKGKKPPKNPEQEFLQCFHYIGRQAKTRKGLKTAKFGIPAVAFKEAMVRAAKANDVAMTDAQRMFFVKATHGDLVEITSCSEPVMRTDHVRLQGKTADVRYRPMFEDWECTLTIEYNLRQVTAEQLVAWCNLAGFANGVGEWRPGGKQSSGIYGRWEITTAEVFEPDLEKQEESQRKKAEAVKNAA